MSELAEYRHKLIHRLHLPADVLEGAAIIQMIGRYEVTIENYKALLSYSDTAIRVLTKQNTVEITGTQLEINYFTNVDMKVTGMLDTISYIEKGRG